MISSPTATILVIDDDPDLRFLLRGALEFEGYAVFLAGNGRIGIEVVCAHHVDLVITDIVMPEMEGIETIMVLRRLFPELPILAISGGGAKGGMVYLNSAAKLGADRILAKPFGLTDLFRLVTELLDRHPATA